MGPEILGPIFELLGAGVGIVLFLFLSYRSARSQSRPFALPTLVASLIAAACVNASSSQQGITPFLFSFAGASIVFGLHAHAIQSLLSLTRSPASGQ